MMGCPDLVGCGEGVNARLAKGTWMWDSIGLSRAGKICSAFQHPLHLRLVRDHNVEAGIGIGKTVRRDRDERDASGLLQGFDELPAPKLEIEVAAKASKPRSSHC